MSQAEESTFKPAGPTLNTVPAGLDLAVRIVELLKRERHAVLDFAEVERLTPSFANALVMTILDAVGLDELERKLRVANASPLVSESWFKAIERYQRGIRLSTQRQNVA
jgi:hypothetical protein